MVVLLTPPTPTIASAALSTLTGKHLADYVGT